MKVINVAMITNDLTLNGISSVIMNYSVHMDPQRVHVTIIAGDPIDEHYEKMCSTNGIGLVRLPKRKESSVKYYMALFRKLKKQKYDMVHVHGNSATISVELLIAWLKGIGVRIAHSHNCTCNSMRAHKLLLPLFNKLYTKGYACSSLAGEWLFGKGKFGVLPNGFQLTKFSFDEIKRDEIRCELGIENKYVIGTIARFNDQKNHPYLLRVFEEVAKEKEDAYLVLVGDGPNLEAVKRIIQVHPYKDRIIYYGETNHAEWLYDAFDVFVLPTKFEGLGIVFIEAQINGLHVVTTNTVPEEVNINHMASFLPLSNDVGIWKDEILKLHKHERDNCLRNHYSEFRLYEINENAQFLENEYSKLMESKK